METGKIFMAEDDAEDRWIISEAMEHIKAAHLMLFAENGVLMLDLLKKHYERNELPCLIVLDLNMPKMNGTETLSHIKNDERFRNIPVIIYSTSINPFEKEKCMRLGAHSYITKPITFSDGVATAKTFHAFCKVGSVS